ncbi:MAG TPA: 4'-phosphopantetheinyl transferase superfamily protein [Dyella sp.]|nr:4'-phosphopantetheinyl transferase superfamily protein [Dyella sp.]
MADGFFGQAVDALRRAGAGPLATGEVCVAVFDTRAWAGTGEAAWRDLDPSERARAERFRFEADRSAYTLSHVLWRAVLAVCLDRPADGGARVRLDARPLVAPRLPDDPGCATSLSRSGPFAAAAVARAGWVGVDIERFPPRQPLEALLEAVATPAERAAVGAPDDAGPGARAALRLWTDKEAVLKAWGVGLTLDPRRVDTLARPVRPFDRPDGACHLHALVLPGGLVGSLALPPGAGPVRQILAGPPGAAPAATICDD